MSDHGPTGAGARAALDVARVPGASGGVTRAASSLGAPLTGLLLAVGFCGGLTTFSAMCLDTFILLLEGDFALAATYLVSVVVLSLAAAWLGYLMAARLNRLPAGG